MERVGLSPEQRKLLLHHRLHPADSAFNLAHLERLDGWVDVQRLRASLEFVLGRSAGLNLVFPDGDDEHGHRHSGTPRVEILDAPPADGADAEAEAVAAELGRRADRPFPPATWPLYDVALYRGRHATYLAMVFSHLVSDAISMFTLGETVAKHYAGPLPQDYLDGLERLHLNVPSEAQTARAVDELRAMLAGSPGPAHEPLAGGRRRDGTLPGVTRQVRLPADLDAALRDSELVARAGAYTVFLAAHAVVLSALAGRPEVTVGIPLATRRTWQQMYALGFFVNTLPLALDLSAVGTFAELCELVATRVRSLLRHKLLDLSAHAAEVFPGRRDPSVTPDNTITHYRKPFPLDIPDVRTETLFVPRTLVRYPLSVNVRESARGFVLGVEYADHLAAADPVAMLEQVLRTAVRDPLAAPSTMPVLDPATDDAVDRLPGAGHPGHQVPASLDAWFTTTARRLPDRVAVSDPSGALSYAELDDLACRVAAELTRTRAGNLVAVAMRPRRELPAVLLGVLRSGRAYVPLDPQAPPDRLRRILGCCAAGADGELLLLADPDLLTAATDVRRLDPALLLAGEPGPTGPAPAPGDLAYVIFTSGSTGEPKGVQVTHRNVARLFAATAEHVDVTADDVWCLFHSYAFDFSVWEMFGALLHGGRLVVPSADAVRSATGTAAMLRDEGVTILNQTPSAFRRLVDVLDRETADALAVRWVVFGGEALNLAPVRAWAELVGDRARLANMYGITEVTVHATVHELDPADLDAVPENVVGRPLSDLRVAVVDRYLRRCPLGVPGEILLSGDGVARGYLAEPTRSAERFRTGTRYGERVYRTGDRGLLRPDGTLVHLGRVDRQVQLRGYRIEPGEVENALRAAPGVRDAFVAVHTPDGGEPVLAAWLVADPGDDAGVRDALAARLPRHMHPGVLVRLAELPLTVNGKVDARALPPPVRRAPAAESGDPLVAAVARIWAEVIGVPGIGPDDSFFDAGGSSMSMMRAYRRLGTDLRPLLDDAAALDGLSAVVLYDHPTPRALAGYLRSGTAPEPSLAPVRGRRAVRRVRAGQPLAGTGS